MRYELQQLLNKGYPALAWQLEAMMNTEPGNLDDLENLVTLLDNLVEEFETKVLDAYDQGHSEGYSEAEWENSHRYEDGYDDGRNEGYEDGFQDGIKEGMASQEYQD